MELLQELGGARGLCVHPVIIVRLAPQISGLAEAGHAPLVRAPHRGRSRGRRTCSGTCACPTAAVLISGSRPPPSLIHHLSTKLIRPPVAHNILSLKHFSTILNGGEEEKTGIVEINRLEEHLLL